MLTEDERDILLSEAAAEWRPRTEALAARSLIGTKRDYPRFGDRSTARSSATCRRR